MPLPEKESAAFCNRWKVVEFAMFGSAVRDDFSAGSDIDALVAFSSNSTVKLKRARECWHHD